MPFGRTRGILMAFPSISGARCGETGPCEQTRVCPFSPGAPAPVSFTSVPQGRCPDPFQGGLKAKQITERAEPPPRWEEAGLRVGAGLGGPGRPAGCGQLSAASGLGLAGQSRGDNRAQQRRRLESRAATRWRHGPRKAGPARPDPARPGPALEPEAQGDGAASREQAGGRKGGVGVGL